MAVLEPVHVLEQDRATAKMEVTKINATRSFGLVGLSGPAIWTWQNGHWFGLGGQEVPEEHVPLEFRQCIKDVPVVVETRGPAVITTCEFCGEQMNRSAKEAHLIAHVRETLGAAGRLPPAPLSLKDATTAPPPPREEPTTAPLTPQPPPIRQRTAAS